MTVKLYPYKMASESAKALANALGVKRIKHEGSRYRPKVGDRVINWGSSNLPPNIMSYPAQVINNPGCVAAVTNKLSFFQLFYNEEDLVVPFTTSSNQVRQWLNEGKIVVARTKLTGHSGEGIVLLEGAGAEIVEAPLYTLYKPKKEEYRVHCYRKQVDNANNLLVFDIQRKAKRNDVPREQANYQIRNLAGGFIYARQQLNVPECVEDVALKVFERTGLDFGAIDIIYNDKENKAYALEVNTAPGLAGTTLDKYVEMIGRLTE